VSMTSQELLQYELDQVRKQIEACFAGMSDEAFTTKCAPNGMSPAEILEHLADAYEAFIVTLRGEKYNFGSFVIDPKTRKNLEKAWTDQRKRAVEVAMTDDDKVMKEAYDYLVGHDNYHVSQLVLSRLQVEPGWDSYLIYG
jgi:uncharacterized damage-inducible protein DinB